MDEHRLKEIYVRWGGRLNRRTDDPGYQDQWFYEQCGGCIHWLALGGEMGADWGVCSSRSSPFDGTVRFEHDGCEHFEEDPGGFGIQRG